MPNLERPYDILDTDWEQTGEIVSTFARLQSELLQRIARGEELAAPQHIDIMGEQDPFFPRRVRLASGFLAQVLGPVTGICVFVLHADELHRSESGTPYIILRTIVVGFQPNGMVYIKTHSKLADQSIVDCYMDQGQEEKNNVIPLRAAIA